jgi:hypothetical protein
VDEGDALVRCERRRLALDRQRLLGSLLLLIALLVASYRALTL